MRVKKICITILHYCYYLLLRNIVTNTVPWQQVLFELVLFFHKSRLNCVFSNIFNNEKHNQFLAHTLSFILGNKF